MCCKNLGSSDSKGDGHIHLHAIPSSHVVSLMGHRRCIYVIDLVSIVTHILSGLPAKTRWDTTVSGRHADGMPPLMNENDPYDEEGGAECLTTASRGLKIRNVDVC